VLRTRALASLSREPSLWAPLSILLASAVRRAAIAVRARLAVEAAAWSSSAATLAAYARLAALASASLSREPSWWAPLSISSASAVRRAAIAARVRLAAEAAALVVVGGDARRVRAPRGACRGLVSVGAFVVGGGACRVRASCGARLGLVVDGARVVGPVVDLIGLGRASLREWDSLLLGGTV